MNKRLTVFYSWQSDSPSNLNRNFVEKALQEALKQLHSEVALEPALRDSVVKLDKDTQEVSGSPPIAETILRKIEDCMVFVADLSFVGESKNGFKNASDQPRQFPNPNVLIEYGYALRCHSHSALVAVMNTAYGRPSAESLPFDLRHLRWPIVYHLADPAAPDKKEQFARLVEALKNAIGMVLSNNVGSGPPLKEFIPQKPTKSAAVFFDSGAELITDRSGPVVVPDGAKAYLRLYPSVPVASIKSELEARALVTNGNLQPMGRVNGWGFDRNIFGAIAHETPEDGKLWHFTQLFLTREIWGIDASVLNADRLREQQQRWGQNSPNPKYIANGYIEEFFVRALHNYLIFAQSHLKLPPPLKIEAGMTGIKDYRITNRDSHLVGKSLHDTILWQDEIAAYGNPAWEILAPFFDQIWDNCGIPRTAEQQADLVRRFTRTP